MTVSERIGTLGAMGDILSFIDPKDNYPTTSIRHRDNLGEDFIPRAVLDFVYTLLPGLLGHIHTGQRTLYLEAVALLFGIVDQSINVALVNVCKGFS